MRTNLAASSSVNWKPLLAGGRAVSVMLSVAISSFQARHVRTWRLPGTTEFAIVDWRVCKVLQNAESRNSFAVTRADQRRTLAQAAPRTFAQRQKIVLRVSSP